VAAPGQCKTRSCLPANCISSLGTSVCLWTVHLGPKLIRSDLLLADLACPALHDLQMVTRRPDALGRVINADDGEQDPVASIFLERNSESNSISVHPTRLQSPGSSEQPQCLRSFVSQGWPFAGSPLGRVVRCPLRGGAAAWCDCFLTLVFEPTTSPPTDRPSIVKIQPHPLAQLPSRQKWVQSRA
jgi:hypothetical protein